jgi:hypothetical protein
MARASLLLFAVLLTGCYSYVPQRPGEIPPGTEVRVHLSSDGARRVTETYPYVTGTIEGRLERWASDVEVSFPIPPTPGMVDRGLRNRIVIPQTDVVGIDLKQRDQARTAALSVGFGALVAVAAIGIFGGVFGGSTIDEPAPPEDILVPFWIRIFP